MPPGLASNVSDLVNGFRDYQELVLTRGALRDIYGVTLTLAMLMAILGAVTAALRFAGNMEPSWKIRDCRQSRPVLRLNGF